MQRDLIRVPSCFLLCWLMLTACGVSETGVSPPEELLGSQESALCSGTSVTSLTLSGIDAYCGELAGSGTWAVAWPANAVRLEYYLDGALSASEERRPDTAGTFSGSWYYSKAGVSTGSHTFLVKAIPMVIDSADNRTTCWDSPGRSISRTLSTSTPLPSTSLSCSRTSSTTITCTGTGSGGSGTLSPMWRTRNFDYSTALTAYSAWSPGTWTQSFHCEQTLSTTADKLWIEHKVSDSCPTESTVKSSAYFLCGPADCLLPACGSLGVSCTAGSSRKCTFPGTSCKTEICTCTSTGLWDCVI
ncbi:MAG TPA: hypothetical protein VFZ09_07315 [Archangium sp.]|uniref:hypothetical protein n=1 Tax=Archangium sp. TaxID=1872627 RepID=UPI002E3811E7|nr:hypothetical protein [Archangium sp.]HEX5746035.1 hypothetical protein [Archangium sp.]